MEQGRQVRKVMAPGSGPARGWELVIPNPKLKLMDQVREVLRVKHYAIRTEQAYCESAPGILACDRWWLEKLPAEPLPVAISTQRA